MSITEHGARAGTISGAALGSAAAHDPQMVPPTRPKLVSGVEVAAWTNGLVLLNGPEQVNLGGRAAVKFLPVLLPALDGTRTVEEIAEALGVPAAAVTNAVALLFNSGVLEEGTWDGDDPLADALSRTVDTGRRQANGHTAADAVRASRVTVLGDDELAARVSESLGAVGATVVDDRPDLVITAFHDVEDPAAVAAADGAGVPWLRARLTGETLELGPVFVADETPCYECFRRGTELHDRGRADATMLAWAAELIVLEAMALATRSYSHGTGIVVIVHDLVAGESTKVPLGRLVGCARCLPGTVDGEGDGIAALAYEEAVALAPRALLNPRAHQEHYRSSNIALAGELREHPAADAIALPPVDLTILDGDPVGIDGFPVLLATGFGLEPGELIHHYAPTGGNLGSPEAFVLLRREAAGVPAGVYGYEPRSHRLARVRLPDRGAARLLDHVASDAPMTIIQIGAWGRLYRKYGPLAFRLSQLDAGVAAAQLDFVADRLGVELTRRHGWDELLLLHALALPELECLVTAVVDVG